MSAEYIRFELTLYFEPELYGSIDQLKHELARLLNQVTDVQDVDIRTLESGKV